MSVIGQRVLRREDPRFLTGTGTYVDNMALEGAQHVAFVRSQVAHAVLGSIDASALDEVPGVRLFTAADFDGSTLPIVFPRIDTRMPRPVMAHDRVRYVGEIVAALVAPTREAGADAAELVVVDYEPLPVVVDPEEAARDEVLLFPELGTNTCSHLPDPPDPDLFDGCEVVVSGRLRSQRIAPAPMEPRAATATVDGDGRLVAWLSTQTPHTDRKKLADALGLDRERIRVVGPDVGGGFGAKGLYIEEVLVCWLALRLGGPVRWTETRSESMLAIGHARAQVLDFRIGGSRDGRVAAYRLHCLQDVGAYPWIGAYLPQLTRKMTTGVYAIPRAHYEGRAVVTNTAHVTAFRGAGRPEACQAIERALDLFAAEVGVDPAEVRRRNLVPPEDFPYTTATGTVYDCGDYARALDTALTAAGIDDLRAEQRRRRETHDPVQLGIGVSVYVEVTNGGAEGEFGAVEMTEDGRAILRTGSFSHGQGHETTFAMIVAERLGLPLDAVTVVYGDTDTVARGGGTYASKSTQIGGTVAARAATEVAERAARVAADLLEANPVDVVLDPDAGRFHVAGTAQPSIGWTDVTRHLAAEGRLAELAVERDFTPESGTFPFGAHVAVVEVDTETGGVTLARIVAVDDAGTIINPVIAEGQVHGGIATGVAQALVEAVAYDELGNPLNPSFLGYSIVSAAELPSFELVSIETPTPVNELGAKGIGESGTVGSTPAVQSAVCDALAHLGVRHVEMPLSGENVWRALEAARA